MEIIEILEKLIMEENHKILDKQETLQKEINKIKNKEDTLVTEIDKKIIKNKNLIRIMIQIMKIHTMVGID